MLSSEHDALPGEYDTYKKSTRGSSSWVRRSQVTPASLIVGRPTERCSGESTCGHAVDGRLAQGTSKCDVSLSLWVGAIVVADAWSISSLITSSSERPSWFTNEYNVPTDGLALPVSTCETKLAETLIRRAISRSDIPRASRAA